MSDSKKKLETALAPVLKAAGYRKRARTWHREWTDTLTVFNIQKSQWSDQFYLNCGIYLKALGDAQHPPEYECHIRERMDQLVPDAERLNRLLDFHWALGENTRLSEIVESYASDCRGFRSMPTLRRFENWPRRSELSG
jgi:hypothetical protein